MEVKESDDGKVNGEKTDDETDAVDAELEEVDLKGNSKNVTSFSAVSKYYKSHLNVRFVVKSTKQLCTFFNFKDKVPSALRSSVGQTTRHLRS